MEFIHKPAPTEAKRAMRDMFHGVSATGHPIEARHVICLETKANIVDTLEPRVEVVAAVNPDAVPNKALCDACHSKAEAPTATDMGLLCPACREFAHNYPAAFVRSFHKDTHAQFLRVRDRLAGAR